MTASFADRAVDDELDYDPSLHALGLWERLSLPAYSCIFPPGFEPDWQITRAIREDVYPWYVPLYMCKEFLAPNNEKVIMPYHVIGRWTPIMDDPGKKPVNAPRPSTGFPFRGGYIYPQRTWAAKWPDGSLGKSLLCPDPAVPWDWDAYYWMQAAAWRLLRRPGPIKNDIEARIKAEAELEQRQLAGVQSEAKYKLRNDRVQVKRAVAEEHRRLGIGVGAEPSRCFTATPI